MTSQPEPEIILYDLACTKNTCFSPIVWRIRLMLNYKQIPYRTIFLEFPDIEPTLKELGLPPSPSPPPYTVPTIQHPPTNHHITDSTTIAHFLELTYPTPPLPLTFPLAQDLTTLLRTTLAPALHHSLPPREPFILTPYSATYFTRTRESALGHPLSALLSSEDSAWETAVQRAGTVEELLGREGGPFVMGMEPSFVDFWIAGGLECVRVVDEGVFGRVRAGFGGLVGIWEECGRRGWMVRRD